MSGERGEVNREVEQSRKVVLESLGLYKLLKEKFGKNKFTLDDIDEVGVYENYLPAHFIYLESTGVLVNEKDDSDFYHLAKDMPEAA